MISEPEASVTGHSVQVDDVSDARGEVEDRDCGVAIVFRASCLPLGTPTLDAGPRVSDESIAENFLVFTASSDEGLSPPLSVGQLVPSVLGCSEEVALRRELYSVVRSAAPFSARQRP